MHPIAKAMRRKKVWWAPGPDLRKVRLFLPEDAPIQAGLSAQEHLQAKGSWLLHAAGHDVDDSLPPGFESYQPVNHVQVDVSLIPMIGWKCPPSISLCPEWLVVAGEESQEIIVQSQRAHNLLEAFYPRQSNVPLNPSVSPDVESVHFDDSKTPLVPITAVEEEDSQEQAEEASATVALHGFDSGAPPGFGWPDVQSLKEPEVLPVPLKPASSSHAWLQNHLNGSANFASPSIPYVAQAALRAAEPDVAAAASAAFTAILKSEEQGSLIDRDLLIKLLSDPAQLEKLRAEFGLPKPAQQVAPSGPFQLPPPTGTTIPSGQFTKPMLSQYAMASGAMPQQGPVLPIKFNSAVNSNPAMKDPSYYKSLIQRHGEDKQEHSELSAAHPNGGSVLQSRLASQNVMRSAKPCMYFNTPRGCRNGANCLYLHDVSVSVQPMNEQLRRSKRFKLDEQI